jgi:hypothetical protein
MTKCLGSGLRIIAAATGIALVSGLSLSHTQAEVVPVEGLPGRGTDLSVGADGSAWMIGWDVFDKNREIFRWTNSAWSLVEGRATRIAVDPQGNPWALNRDGRVMLWRDGVWVDMPGRGTDIAVGAQGHVWMVGWYKNLLDTDSAPQNRDIYRWAGSDWEQVGGGAVRVGVMPDGTPWIIDRDGRIRRLTPEGWAEVGGRAQDIGMGADGSIWITGHSGWSGDGAIDRWDGSNWVAQGRSGRAITVGPEGMPWFANDDGDLFRGVAGFELRLEPPVVVGGVVELRFLSLNGANYTVHLRRTLVEPWRELIQVTGTGQMLTVSDRPPPEANASFYQLTED